MDAQNIILELKDTCSRLHEGANAIELMTLGLAQAGDPYERGFGAISAYFKENMIRMQGLLEQLPQALEQSR